MKKLLLLLPCLLLLSPLLLFGQVSVDTVVRLPHRPWDIFYIPGVNKLYINTSANRYMMVVDCETYAITKVIPTGLNAGVATYQTLDWRRDKLYCIYTTPLDMAVFDTRLDSLVKWLPIQGSRAPCYVSTNDEVYAVDTCINVIDCEADSVVRTIPPVPGHAWGKVAWDSVGRKVYVTGRGAGTLFAYSCDTDSHLATISHPDIGSPIVIAISPASRRAYAGWSTFGRPVAVLDCKADTFIRDLDIDYEDCFGDDIWNPVEDKVYLPGLGWQSHDTTFGVNCAADSVVSRTPVDAQVAQCWTPWSNRLYALSTWDYVRVLDCRTDSAVVDRLELGNWPIGITCSETNQRVYVICAGDTTLYVLREDAGAIAETPEPERAEPMGPTLLTRAQLMTELQTDPSLSLFDASGRRILDPKSAMGVLFVRTPATTRRVVVIR